MTQDRGRATRIAERALLLLAAAAVLLGFRDFGTTWDEPLQARYGELVLDYFRSGYRDTRYAELWNLRYYGPPFEALAAIAYGSTGLPRYPVRHLLIAVTGLLCLAAAMLYGRRLGSPLAPPLAGLALLTWPRFAGHSFNNSKDIPFAAAFAWAMLAVLRFAQRGREASWPDAALTGLAVGVALALRPGGFLLFALLLGAWLLAFWRTLGEGRGTRRPAAGVLLKLAAVLPLAWGVMVAFWPFAHEDPILNPLRALRVMERFPDPVNVLFEGRQIPSDQIPRHYAPKYLLITTPPGHLLFLLLGIGAALASRAGALARPGSRLAARLAVAWFLFPLAYVVARRSPLYDEIRHLLFVVPAGALLVALGLDWAATRLRVRPGAAALAGCAVLLLPLPAIVRLHPYETSYFNAFVGGVAGAAGRYDTDYWLSSYKEAMEWVNRQPVPAAGPRRVLVAALPQALPCASAYAAPHVEVLSVLDSAASLPEDVDDYIGSTRWGLDGRFPQLPVVHRVGRDGATFAVIRSRHPAAPR